MRLVSRIDAEGFFVEDVLLGEEEPLPAGTIESRPPEGLHVPRWDGRAWVEAMALQDRLQAARQAKISQIRSRLDIEASAIMPIWERFDIQRTARNDPRSISVDNVVKKGRDIEQYLNQPQRTLAEIQALTWDTWA